VTESDAEWAHRVTQEFLAAEPIADMYTDTADGNALRLIALHGDRFRRIADMKRWAMDYEDRRIREVTKDLARALPESDRNAVKFKRESMSPVGISGCVRMAETDPRVSILANELDSHLELLNAPNGVVDLRTGLVREHDPTLLLSRITAYPAAIEEPHPRWDKFLMETFGGDLELINYINRLFGLALLGTITEHILPFLHGIGANGKSVLTSVLQGLLGNADNGGYAVSAPDGFLMAGRENKHETEMARLRGARLVVCSEQTSGRRFDEQKVKRLTGDDVLTGRFMRGDFFDFRASHLIWVMSNHLPEVKEGGLSFWRRVRLIPFKHVVPEDQQIKDYQEVLLATEGAAILGWAIAGAVEVLRDGMQTPESVLAATQEYELSEDTLASFIKERCIQMPHFWVPMSKLREEYLAYCDEMGIEMDSRLSAKALGSRLRSEFGVIEGRISKPQMKTYKGIALQGRDVEDE
jgi:putative DNA primase/helicase